MALLRGWDIGGVIVRHLELDRGVGEHGTDDDENSRGHPDRDHEDIILILGDGTGNVDRRLRAAQTEGLRDDISEFAAGEQRQ